MWYGWIPNLSLIHILPEVLTNCNRILILKKGEISGEITPREVNKKQLGDMITSVE